MPQIIPVDPRFSDAQLAAMDGGLDAFEAQLGLREAPAGTPARRRLRRLSARDKDFCRQAVSIMTQHPQVLPPAVAAEVGANGLAAMDQMLPRLQRMARIQEVLDAWYCEVGQRVRELAGKAYGHLKLAGKSEGLDALRRELSSAITRPRRKATKEARDTA